MWHRKSHSLIGMACVTQHLRTWHRVQVHLQQIVRQWLPWVPQETQWVRFPKMPFTEPLRLAMDACGCLYALSRLYETVHRWVPNAGEWKRTLHHVANPRDVVVVPMSCGVHGNKLIVAEALGFIGMTRADEDNVEALTHAKWNSATSGMAMSNDGMLVHLDGSVSMCYVRSIETTAVLHSWYVPEWRGSGHYTKAIMMVHQNKVVSRCAFGLTVTRCLLWGTLVAICWCTPFRVDLWSVPRHCVVQKDAV